MTPGPGDLGMENKWDCSPGCRLLQLSVNRLITSIEIKLGIPISHHFPLEQRKNIDSNLNLGKKIFPTPRRYPTFENKRDALSLPDAFWDKLYPKNLFFVFFF